MRIIAGKNKGRRLIAPRGETTHPMGDRVRETIFNILSDVIDGAEVLDLYAGSGAVGLEAHSRGAANVVIVERDKNAIEAIKKNIAHTESSDNVTLKKMNVKTYLNNVAKNQFDLVFVDPPYDKFNNTPLQLIVENALSANGLMVLSQPGRASDPKVDGVVVVDTKSFGKSNISFYRRA